MRVPAKFCLAVLLVAAFSPESRPQPPSTVLDFEGFADSTLLTTQIPGVIFTNAIVLTAGISLNEFEFPPHSGVNVISDNGGPISVSFASPAMVVSGYFTYATALTVTAYDANNKQVALATSKYSSNMAISGVPGSTPNELITVAYASGISTVTFSGAPGGGSFVLDDLTVSPPIVVSTTAPPAPVPQPLSFSQPSVIDIPLGKAFSVTLDATGGAPPYIWSGPGAPAGITVAQDGVVAGVPALPGIFQFLVTVTDEAGASQTLFMNITVFGITTSSLPDAVAYAAYSQTVAAIGVPPYSFSGSGFPSGISISSNGTISGTATKPGVYTILVQALDADFIHASAQLSLTVNPPGNLAVPPASLPSGTQGVSYSQPLNANGGIPPYTWTVSGGALPPGLNLSSSGIASGFPSTTGNFTFTAQAMDAGGSTASGAISLTIAPPPLILSAGPTLPSGMTGIDYPLQIFTASGGVPPYTYALAAGTLPPGLNLGSDGTISGIPTSVGDFSFSVAATDSTGTATAVNLSAAIRPPATDLVLSAGSLVFSSAVGSGQLPPAQTVQVQSSAPGTVLLWSASVSQAVPWLSVMPASGATPGSFALTLTSQALALAASSTPYQTTVTVTCAAPSPCQGNTQTLNVLLTVSSVAPRPILSTGLLNFLTSANASQPLSQTLLIQNGGGATLQIDSVSSSAPWVSVNGLSLFSASLQGGQQTALTIIVDPSGFAPGFYRTTLTVSSTVGMTTIPLTLFVTGSQAMTLSSLGSQFSIASGGAPAITDNSFEVSTPSPSTINWTAAVVSGATWLTTSTPSGTSSNASPGVVTFAIDPVAAAGLAGGIYYGTIRVASPQVFDSPLDFQVVLYVGPASSPTIPAPSPDGFVFITSAGTSSASQNVQIFSTSAKSTSYQASASTSDGNAWLSVSPATAVAAPAAPAQSQISVNPAGRPPGVYYGGVSYAGAGAAVRTVNVTLIVTPAAPATCTPSQLAPARVSPLNNFDAVVSVPTSLAVQLLNDCGVPVANGAVSVSFSNGDSSIELSLVNSSTGLYSGTWYPLQPASQIAITVAATVPGFAAAQARYTGTVRPGNAPTISPMGTLHVFAPEPGAALAPGTIVQIYGSRLAGVTVSASVIPLLDTLGTTSVSIGGMPAPLYYVSPSQINAQVPFELMPNGQYQVEVNSNGVLSPPATIQVSAAAPGVAVLPNGIVIAEHSDGSLVSEQSPAKPGELLVIYAAGLGVTNPPVASGAGSPSSPLARPVITPVLTIGSEVAEIQFAGLTPTLVGLYQINVTIPADAPNGDLSLVLSQGGIASVPAILPVHN